jgi:hypothetical protein
MGPVSAMANNLIEVLATVPPTLAAAWGIWLVAGGMLAMWFRRAGLEPELAAAPAPAPRAVSRPKSASRAPSGVRHEFVPMAPVDEEPAASSYDPPPGVVMPAAPREKKPIVIGDPFGDLATLLDQATAAATTTPAPAAAPPQPHRTPGESPILSSSGVPLRRGSDEPKLS